MAARASSPISRYYIEEISVGERGPSREVDLRSACRWQLVHTKVLGYVSFDERSTVDRRVPKGFALSRIGHCRSRRLTVAKGYRGEQQDDSGSQQHAVREIRPGEIERSAGSLRAGRESQIEVAACLPNVLRDRATIGSHTNHDRPSLVPPNDKLRVREILQLLRAFLPTYSSLYLSFPSERRINYRFSFRQPGLRYRRRTREITRGK